MQHVVAMYRRGLLATLQEGALVAGVTRQRVLAVLKAADVDWIRARQQYIARQRTHAVMVSEGRTVRRPSKRDLRRQATRAKKAWDKRHEPNPDDGGPPQSGAPRY